MPKIATDCPEVNRPLISSRGTRESRTISHRCAGDHDPSSSERRRRRIHRAIRFRTRPSVSVRGRVVDHDRQRPTGLIDPQNVSGRAPWQAYRPHRSPPRYESDRHPAAARRWSSGPCERAGESPNNVHRSHRDNPTPATRAIQSECPSHWDDIVAIDMGRGGSTAKGQPGARSATLITLMAFTRPQPFNRSCEVVKRRCRTERSGNGPTRRGGCGANRLQRQTGIPRQKSPTNNVALRKLHCRVDNRAITSQPFRQPNNVFGFTIVCGPWNAMN